MLHSPLAHAIRVENGLIDLFENPSALLIISLPRRRAYAETILVVEFIDVNPLHAIAG